MWLKISILLFLHAFVLSCWESFIPIVPGSSSEWHYTVLSLLSAPYFYSFIALIFFSHLVHLIFLVNSITIFKEWMKVSRGGLGRQGGQEVGFKLLLLFLPVLFLKANMDCFRVTQSCSIYRESQNYHSGQAASHICKGLGFFLPTPTCRTWFLFPRCRWGLNPLKWAVFCWCTLLWALLLGESKPW